MINLMTLLTKKYINRKRPDHLRNIPLVLNAIGKPDWPLVVDGEEARS